MGFDTRQTLVTTKLSVASFRFFGHSVTYFGVATERIADLVGLANFAIAAAIAQTSAPMRGRCESDTAMVIFAHGGGVAGFACLDVAKTQGVQDSPIAVFDFVASVGLWTGSGA